MTDSEYHVTETNREVERVIQSARWIDNPREARLARLHAESAAQYAGLSRRKFLQVLGATGACVLCDAVLCPDPAAAQAQELLSAPIDLTSGGVLKDKHYLIDGPLNAAPWSTANGAIRSAENAPNLTLSNIRITTGFTTWQSPAWDAVFLNAIQLRHIPGSNLHDIWIDGFPFCGIRQWRSGSLPNGNGDLDGCRFTDIDVTRCGRPFSFRTITPLGIASCVQFLRLVSNGCWTEPGGQGHTADLFVAGGLRDSKILHCSFTGHLENGSFKIASMIGCEIGWCTSGPMNIASSLAIADGYVDGLDLHDCTIDKNLIDPVSVFGPVPGYNGIYIQGASSGTDGRARRIRIHDSVIRCGTASDNDDGHAIMCDIHEIELDVRGVTFEGWNGVRGSDPAHALARYGTQVTSNADFESVNTFVNQTNHQTGTNAALPAYPWPALDPTRCRPSVPVIVL